ncbi:uncharacterized protein SCHCODRAFT_02519076 [Schizophyllum commune H4-8]|uniref:uncharacterized protein n=1 Tax=Schizophyllum commune (strain H4-8 / FGSC 9210) TaxID=578458 RepID=UPI00215E6DEE|nr:uncharacterized protein SCHCODRAFT_02519076 [Schizophyllum commune H4-8]KAI5886157.1 hypothetical protein SCHCODRAFT_02519076 [Schizophyllum commune H4-8]
MHHQVLEVPQTFIELLGVPALTTRRAENAAGSRAISCDPQAAGGTRGAPRAKDAADQDILRSLTRPGGARGREAARAQALTSRRTRREVRRLAPPLALFIRAYSDDARGNAVGSKSTCAMVHDLADRPTAVGARRLSSRRKDGCEILTSHAAFLAAPRTADGRGDYAAESRSRRGEAPSRRLVEAESTNSRIFVRLAGYPDLLIAAFHATRGYKRLSTHEGRRDAAHPPLHGHPPSPHNPHVLPIHRERTEIVEDGAKDSSGKVEGGGCGPPSLQDNVQALPPGPARRELASALRRGGVGVGGFATFITR